MAFGPDTRTDQTLSERHKPEEIAAKLRPEWMFWSRTGRAWRTRRVRSGSPRWLRDELLDGEIFYSLPGSEIVIESWRRHTNSVRPHASLGYQPSAPEVFEPAL